MCLCSPRGMNSHDPNNDAFYHKRRFDVKGNPIFCIKCAKDSDGTRDLIQCDMCNTHWHLDCLNPPRSTPFRYSLEHKRDIWTCPRHISHDLNQIDPMARDFQHGIRSHKVRVPKDKHRIVYAARYKPSYRNNGLIELEDETSSAESFESQEEEGIPRIPVKGVKNDFINKVKA